MVANYTVTDEHGATDRDADDHADRHQRRAGGGCRHQLGQRGHARSPARSRPTTATSMTARLLTYSAQCAGRRPDAQRGRQLQLRCRQRRLPAPGAGRRQPTWWPTTRSPTSTARPRRATLTITLTGTNDAPVAVADTNSGRRGQRSITGTVATNDSDVDDGATLTYASMRRSPA